MKDEIKEILDNLDFEVNYMHNWVEPLGLDKNTWKQLLDYITNLQQIEKDHQKLNGELRKENKKLKEELQQEKKDFKEANDYCFKLISCKSKIDKATDLLNRYGNGTFDEQLLNILKGDNND